MKSENKQGSASLQNLLRGGSAFTIALSLQRASMLFMLPIYLHFITPEEYGSISLVLTASVAFAALLGLGLDTAVFRTFFTLAEDPARQQSYLRTMALFLLIVPSVCTAALVVVSVITFDSILGVPAPLVALGFVGTSLYVSASIVPFAVLRATNRLLAYILLNVAFVATQTIALSVAVIWLDLGPAGWLASTCAAGAVMLMFGLILVPLPRSSFDLFELRRSLAFGVPLIPHYFSHWVLSLSDRAILAASVSLGAIGVYNFGYQIGATVGVFFAALQLATQPYYLHAVSGQKIDHFRLGMVISGYSATVMICTFGVALLAPPAINIAFPTVYHPAATLVPWFALAYGLFGLYSVPMNYISLVLGETTWVWLVTGFAALINVLLNVVFVPRYGVEVAAISTVIGYGTLLASMTAYAARRGARPAIDWLFLTNLLAFLCAIYLVVRYSGPTGEVATLIWRAMWLTAICGIAYIGRGFLFERVSERRSRLFATEGEPT